MEGGLGYSTVRVGLVSLNTTWNAVVVYGCSASGKSMAMQRCGYKDDLPNGECHPDQSRQLYFMV